jgi:uncharacterized protein (TIGR00730 family)
MNNMKNICVFAGSNLGSELAFAKNAEELGKIIATSKKKLVYGGGRKGLMGIIADSVLAYDGLVTGVITKQLEEIEVGHKNLSELIIVDSMHQRKEIMFNVSDGIICLPGGVGTLDELFESLTWNHLGIHSKPIVLLNISKYYEPLYNFIIQTIKSGFLPEGALKRLCIANSPEESIDYIDNFNL